MYPLLSLEAFLLLLLPLCQNQASANATVSSHDYRILGPASPFLCRRGLDFVQGRTSPSLCFTSIPLHSSHNAMPSTSFLSPVFPAWRVKLTNEVHDYQFACIVPTVPYSDRSKTHPYFFLHVIQKHDGRNPIYGRCSQGGLGKSSTRIGDLFLMHPGSSGCDPSLIYIITLGELTVSFYFVSQTTVMTIFFLAPIGSHSACMSTPCFFPPQPGCIENQFVTVVSGNELALGTLLYCWSYLSPAWFVSTTYLHYWTESRWLS